MPINKKKKKSHKKKPSGTFVKDLILKDDEQEYAQVIKLLGNLRMECLCFDGTSRIATVRGKMRRRKWVRVDDIVLISLREFQDNKADVIEVYDSTQVRKLLKLGEIPDFKRVSTVENDDSDSDGVFEFAEPDVDEFNIDAI